MQPGATLELLGRIVGTERLAREPREALAINAWCGGHPLTATIVAEWIDQPGNKNRTLSSVRAKLNGRQVVQLLKTDKPFLAAIGAARRSLSRPAWELVRSAALLPFDIFQVEQAATVTGLTESAARDAVTELHRAGWLELVAEAGDRFRILPAVLQYARGRQPLGDLRRRTVLRRAMRYYLERTRLDDPANEAEAAAVLSFVREERAHIVATIVHGFREGLHDLVWQLSVRCGRLFRALGLYRAWERTARLGAAAARRVHAEQQPLAVALTSENLGDVFMHHGRVEEAVACYQQGRSSRQLLDDDAGAAQLLSKLGGAYERLGRDRDALEAYRLSLDLSGEDRLDAAAIPVLRRLVTVTEKSKDADAAGSYASRGRSLCERVGDRDGALWFLLRLGTIQQQSGSSSAALEALRTAEAEARALGDHALRGEAAQQLATVLWALQRPAEAAAAFGRSAEAFAAAEALPRAVAASLQSAAGYRDAGLQTERRDALRFGDELRERITDRPNPVRRDLIDLEHALGEVSSTTGDLDGAARAFAAVLSLTDEGDQLDRARALDGLSQVRRRQAKAEGLDPATASRWREEALANARQAADLYGRDPTNCLARARALHRSGLLLLELGRASEAAEELKASHGAYQLGGPPLEHAQALEELAEALGLLDDADHRQQIADALLASGTIRKDHSEYHESGAADGPLARAASLFEELGDYPQAAAANRHLGELRASLGQHDEAAQAHRACAAALAAAGDRLGVAQALAATAQCLATAGQRQAAALAHIEAAVAFRDERQPQGALTNLEAAVEQAEELPTRSDALVMLAEVHLSTKQPERATAALERALSPDGGLDAGRSVRAKRLLGEASFQLGKFDQAWQVSKDVAASFANQDEAVNEAATRERLAEALERLSRPFEAAQQLVDAGERYKQAAGRQDGNGHLRLQAAAAFQRAGNTYRRIRQSERAVESLTQAKACLEAADSLQARPGVLYDLARAYLDQGGDREAGQAADLLGAYRKAIEPTAIPAAHLREVAELEI